MALTLVTIGGTIALSIHRIQTWGRLGWAGLGYLQADLPERGVFGMKPGAVIGIVDHAANPGGDTREVVEKLHRIDPAVVRADFERAGFVLEGESQLLRNPADDRTTNVFDDKIRGRTDRFVFKFRKP